MQRNKLGSILLFLMISNPIVAFTSVQFGIKMSNNQTIDYWMLTPSAEVEFGSRRFCLSLEGWIGTYTPTVDANGYIIMSHFSAIPLVRIPYKHFILSAGYGLSNVFRREEIHDAGGNLSITSGQIQHGELKAHISYFIPFKPNLSIVMKAGYAYVDRNLKSFSGGIGIAFSLPQNGSNGIVRQIDATPQKTVSNGQPEKRLAPIVRSKQIFPVSALSKIRIKSSTN